MKSVNKLINVINDTIELINVINGIIKFKIKLIGIWIPFAKIVDYLISSVSRESLPTALIN